MNPSEKPGRAIDPHTQHMSQRDNTEHLALDQHWGNAGLSWK